MQRALVSLILRFSAHEQGKQRQTKWRTWKHVLFPFSPAIRSVPVCSGRVVPTASSCFQAWVVQKCGVSRMWSISLCCSQRLLLGMGCATASCFMPLLLPFCMTQHSCLGMCSYSWKNCLLLPGLEYGSWDKAKKLSSQPPSFFLKTAPHRMWAINCKKANEIVMIPLFTPWEDTEGSIWDSLTMSHNLKPPSFPLLL